jgi:hypothetical protein
MAITKLPKSGLDSSAVTAAKIVDGVLVAGDFPDCNVASDRLADDAITNAKLANSAITIRGTSVSLGGSHTVGVDVDWQSKITSDGSTVTTMVAGQGYFVDNSSAAGIVKLPASASRGDTIIIKDYAGNFGTNNTTVQRNGHNIQGNATDSLLKTNRKSVTMVYVDSTKGWLFTDEHDVSDLQKATFTSATGGTVTTSGNDRIHTFTGDGNFVVASVGNSAGGGDKVSYLVVAGGGGGAGADSGGGGAGGFREGKDAPVSSYTVSPLNAPAGLTVSASPGTYPVTIGGGGAGGSAHPAPATDQMGHVGSNSVFSTITSAGGGLGGKGGDHRPNPIASGGAGGSGGGAAQNSTQPRACAGAGNTPSVSPPQGNPGGQGQYGSNAPGSGGGGGATAAGASSSGSGNGGDGGAGATTHITGSPVAYAGGGGGGAAAGHGIPGNDVGTGGTGGGGDAYAPGSGPGGAGTANRGAGGGSGGSPGFCGGTPGQPGGGAGGSGVVIVRYKYQSG